MKKKTIMAVGAHIGDAQLTCGMLLAKHALLGDDIVIVNLTPGERGTPKGWEIPEFKQHNISCAQDFAKGLGGKSIVFDVPDGELYAGKEIEMELAKIMREHQVDGVLYHWPKSMHKDHIQASKITENAIFYAALPTMEVAGLPPAPIRTSIMAENWEDAEDFMPYLYFDVTQGFNLWEENIKKLWLAENSTSFKYLRYYKALAITRGALIGVDYASAFGVKSHSLKQKRESL